jgi:hypothetical protein
MEKIIAKTVSAFMNAEGGTLYSSVDDENNVIGLQEDYQTLKKQNSDGFEIEFRQFPFQRICNVTERLEFICLNIKFAWVFKMVIYCLALPFLSGGAELAKKFVQENGHTKEQDEFYRAAGISREHVWIQRSPPASGAPDLEVVSIETNDPTNTLKEFATSSHPWA